MHCRDPTQKKISFHFSPMVKFLNIIFSKIWYESDIQQLHATLRRLVSSFLLALHSPTMPGCCGTRINQRVYGRLLWAVQRGDANRSLPWSTARPVVGQTRVSQGTWQSKKLPRGSHLQSENWRSRRRWVARCRERQRGWKRDPTDCSQPVTRGTVAKD